MIHILAVDVYKCGECGQSGFASAATLANHVRAKHTLDRPHACERCPMRYATAMSLAGHRKRVHGVNAKGEAVPAKLYPCGECGRVLSSRTKMNNHMKAFHEDKISRFACKSQGCKRVFASPSELKAHKVDSHRDPPSLPLTTELVTSGTSYLVLQEEMSIDSILI